MTIEEAIQNLKESIKSATNKLEYEKYKQDSLQLLVWLESYKTISEYYPEVKKKMNRLEEENMRLLESALRIGKRCEAFESENRELKRLLRLAVEDFDKLENVESCYYPFCGERCPFDCTGGCEEREWKHHDEAMKLLGGAENAEN